MSEPTLLSNKNDSINEASSDSVSMPEMLEKLTTLEQRIAYLEKKISDSNHEELSDFNKLR